MAEDAPGEHDDDVLHIATRDEWAAAQRSGVVAPPSVRSEGFVHCSTQAQLGSTLDRHFRGAGPLVVLRLDLGVIQPHLRWEESRPGERFPHVYAPIPVEAVVSATPVTPPAT
jgi:uncharacterized protein (DUF952 family)